MEKSEKGKTIRGENQSKKKPVKGKARTLANQYLENKVKGKTSKGKKQ